MAVTDFDQLSEIQLRVLEPDNAGATFPSNLWTPAEVLAYANQRQNRFNKETLMLLSQASVPSVAGQSRYVDGMPIDWIATLRATFVTAAALPAVSVHTPLEIGDAWEIDNGLPSGRLPDRPLVFDETTPPLMSFDLAPVAADSLSRVDLLYASLLEVLTGAGDIFDVPDDFVPYVIYGVLADMFGKVGKGQNLPLAAYFESRYTEGIALAEIMLIGKY
jgi:hypothetical protein